MAAARQRRSPSDEQALGGRGVAGGERGFGVGFVGQAEPPRVGQRGGDAAHFGARRRHAAEQHQRAQAEIVGAGLGQRRQESVGFGRAQRRRVGREPGVGRGQRRPLGRVGSGGAQALAQRVRRLDRVGDGRQGQDARLGRGRARGFVEVAPHEPGEGAQDVALGQRAGRDHRLAGRGGATIGALALGLGRAQRRRPPPRFVGPAGLAVGGDGVERLRGGQRQTEIAQRQRAVPRSSGLAGRLRERRVGRGQRRQRVLQLQRQRRAIALHRGRVAGGGQRLGGPRVVAAEQVADAEAVQIVVALELRQRRQRHVLAHRPHRAHDRVGAIAIGAAVAEARLQRTRLGAREHDWLRPRHAPADDQRRRRRKRRERRRQHALAPRGQHDHVRRRNLRPRLDLARRLDRRRAARVRFWRAGGRRRLQRRGVRLRQRGQHHELVQLALAGLAVGQVRAERRRLLRFQLAVGERVDQLVHVADDHASPPLTCAARIARSFLRARMMRVPTVLTGSPSRSAIAP